VAAASRWRRTRRLVRAVADGTVLRSVTSPDLSADLRPAELVGRRLRDIVAADCRRSSCGNERRERARRAADAARSLRIAAYRKCTPRTPAVAGGPFAAPKTARSAHDRAHARQRHRLAEQPVEEDASEEQLRLGRKAAASVPAAPAVEELRAARPREGEDVLCVGRRRRECAERRRIRDAAVCSEECDRREPARELEAATREVAMRNRVAREVRRDTEDGGCATRAACRADRRTNGSVERDDHARRIAERDAQRRIVR
jgi:hypothetical protein